jgi:hypothetical protein
MNRDREFDTKVKQYSAEALEQRAQELVEQRRLARRSKIRSTILSFIFLGGCVFGCIYHAAIRDTVAKWLGSEESEYASLSRLADETDDKGKDGTPEDPKSRKARLRGVMKSAKDHAATVDAIMDNKEPPKSP